MGLLWGGRGGCSSFEVFQTALQFLACWRGLWLDGSRSKPRDSLTVVALGDAILDATPLGQIGDFGPVFIGVGVRTEGTAIAVTASRASTAVVGCTMHGMEYQS